MTARLDRRLFGAGTPEPGSTITVYGIPGRVIAVRDLGPDEIEVDLETEDPPSLPDARRDLLTRTVSSSA
jgi:hypothetical protein